jgi:putative two-component system response regulator
VLAEIASALCEIHHGDVDTGIERLELALHKSEKGQSRIDVLSALVKAYDQASRPEPALQYLLELIERIRDSRQKSILALFGLPHPSSLASDCLNGGDLRALESREAKLRSRLAERQLIDSRMEVLERLAVTADLKDDISGEHGYRVGKLSYLIAKALGWNRGACQSLEFAARLHDIGKIAIADTILLTCTQLMDAERQAMHLHTTIGAELLARSNIAELNVAERIAHFHHEWWDGKGYPMQLRGKRIPIEARIVSLADVFDALTHGRPYSHAWPIDSALDEIRQRRGSQFDPELTDVFLNLVAEVRSRHTDLDGYLAKEGRLSAFAQARERIRRIVCRHQDVSAGQGSEQAR